MKITKMTNEQLDYWVAKAQDFETDIWVQPCVVGAKEKGMVVKDYAVSLN